MTGFDEEALAEAYNRALKLEKAGDVEAAAQAWREVLALDPTDHGGAAVRLAALGKGEMPDKAPPAYVETLFDQHAEVFDEVLVDQLGYAVPLQLHQMLLEHAPGPHSRALDLGCGTGLTGGALNDLATNFIGVDISENMVALAEERDVYDGLYVAEAEDFLENIEDEDNWDLIVATDVMPYLGDLSRIVAGTAKRINPGGWFAFSTETQPEESMDGRGYVITRRHRFAHSETYLRDLLTEHGFDVAALRPITVRLEEGEPICGHLVLARAGG